MDFTEYIDIDSSYRDRKRDTLPANFIVRLSETGMHNTGLTSTDAVSAQVPIYPDAENIDPLAFYTETIQAPLDTIVERTYLPYMFASENQDTLLRLDELPLASTDPTTTTVQLSSEFPRGVVPLGRQDNFYVGDILENVNTGETREITSFLYDDTETIVQSGRVLSYTTSGELELDPLNVIDYTPSNVDRFYQGKTIQFLNGTERVIINSYVNSAGNTVLVLQNVLTTSPSVGDTVNIKTVENWFAEISQPFTTSIPTYPAYRTPLPIGVPNVIYEKVIVLTNSSDIQAMAIVRHTDDTIGVAYQTSTTLFYISSIDDDGCEWGTPVTVRLLGTTLNVTNIGLDVTLIGGFPAIAFMVNELSYFYIEATDTNGTVWGATETPHAGSFVLHPNSVIRVIPRSSNDGVDAGQPQIIAIANGANTIRYSYRDSGLVWADTTIVTTASPGGVTVDSILDFKNNTSGEPTILYKNATSGSLYVLERSSGVPTTWADEIEIDTRVVTNKGSLFTSSDVSVVEIYATYQDATTYDIYIQKTLGASFWGPASAGAVGTLVTDIPTTTGFNLQTETLASGSMDNLDLTIVDGDNIYTQSSTDTTGSIWNVPWEIENTASLWVDSIISIDGFAPTNVYSQGKSIYILKPTVQTPIEGVQYRIRRGDPLESGTGGTASALLAGTLNTVTFPSTASAKDDFYNGDFVWLYNQNVFTIPSPFQMFNDFRQIQDYDGTTRTATVVENFSADVGTLSIAGGNTLDWNILGYDRDSFSPLVYVGSKVTQQQMVCYSVSLLSLILPNKVLLTGNGGLIAFYPYVYVEFFNITAMPTNIISSNNPNASRALFKVPIRGVSDPERQSFVAVSSGMVHTMKFKPNDSFTFSVYLPNGELFETVETDTTSPFPPDPNIQISATFAVKRKAP
ncbi:hypothetical protein OAV62_01280 [bacterium]|nr:hypothetical protein [bacterium]